MPILNNIFPQAQPQNPNIFQRVGGTIMTHLPGPFGMAYNGLNTLTHLIEGTAGNYGQAPSMAGRFWQALFPNFKQNGWNFGGANPQGAVDPSDPNNPLNDPQQQPAQQPPQQPQMGPTFMRYGGGVPINTAWNAARPSFGMTYQQFTNPGSAIGPFGGGVADPNRPDTPLRIDSHPQGIPGWAAAVMADVRARNQV